MRKKIDAGLGSWEAESTRVKQSIQEKKINYMATNRTYKRKWIKPLIATLSTLIVLIGAALMWEQNETTTAPVTSTPIENPPQEIIAAESLFNYEKTLQIIKYQYFYDYNTFFPEERIDVLALNEFLDLILPIYVMDQHKYTFPKDREEHYLNRAAALFTINMRDESFQKYMNTLQSNHGIRNEDYIEHYLFVQEKAAFMENLMHQKYLGYSQDEFLKEEYKKEIEAILGISRDKLEIIVRKHVESYKDYPRAEVTLLKNFDDNIYYSYNEKGELIIVPTLDEMGREYNHYYGSSFDTARVLNYLYNNLYVMGYSIEVDYKSFENLPNLNRISINEFKEALEAFEWTAELERHVENALEYLNVLERSVSMKVEKDLTFKRK